MSTSPTSDVPDTPSQGADPTVDETVRPPLVADALANRGLVEPEGVNAADDGEDEEAAHDVLSGGRPAAAPATDRNAWKTDDELVGAGPKDQSELNHADDVQDVDES